MSPYRFFLISIFDVVACSVCCFGFAQAATNQPNIIVIMADDMGYADAGFTGSEDIKTPNLDAIATSGVIFKQGYVTHPFCGPSRAGLLSGRYQHRFGFETNPAYDPANSVMGIEYYEHKETPGLGGEVDNPNWKSGWQGKKIYNSEGSVSLKVVKGVSKDDYEIDGMSGATITSNGVTNMINFWLGDQGYGPIIKKLNEVIE